MTTKLPLAIERYDESGGLSLPLSFAQQRLWFLDQWQPGTALYNVPAAVRLCGPLDEAALERSLREIVRRHEVLRTTFPTENGQPTQVIVADQPLQMPLVDLSGMAGPDTSEPSRSRSSGWRAVASRSLSGPAGDKVAIEAST